MVETQAGAVGGEGARHEGYKGNMERRSKGARRNEKGEEGEGEGEGFKVCEVGVAEERRGMLGLE